jgi:hypothetical protein
VHFDPDLLQQKLLAIAAKQRDETFMPKKVRERVEKKQRKAEKSTVRKKLAQESAARKASAKEQKKQDDVPSPEKRAKGIIKARKQKRMEEDLFGEMPVNYQPRVNSSRREKPLPTRELNLEEKIRVQVDQKTWVYVDPGADIEAVKAKYRRPAPEKFDDQKALKIKVPKNEDIDDEEVRKLVSMAVPVKQIAKMLEVKPSSVKKIARYMGLKLT